MNINITLTPDQERIVADAIRTAARPINRHDSVVETVSTYIVIATGMPEFLADLLPQAIKNLLSQSKGDIEFAHMDGKQVCSHLLGCLVRQLRPVTIGDIVGRPAAHS